MTLIIAALFVFLLSSIRSLKNNEEYLSKDYTNVIKGFFICIVFISHFVLYKFNFSKMWYDTIGLKIAGKWEQLIVTMFLFYSGYGVMESIKKKGQNYIDGLPRKRILKTWINFAIAVIIFMLVSKYFVVHPFSLKKLVLALLAIDSFGNSNWYILCIIAMYVVTYLSTKTFESRKGRLSAVIVGTVLYCLFMSTFKSKYWYNTCACYTFGFAFSLYKEKFEKFYNEKWILLLAYSFIGFLVAYKLKKNILVYEIYCLLFVNIVLLLSMKIKLNNFVLKWMGANLFPLYIYQRIPMMLFKKYTLFPNNVYLCFGLAFIVTICITFLYIMINKINTSIRDKIRLKCNVSV